MLTSVLATKVGMTQAWTVAGKRMAVTRCQVDGAKVLGNLKNNKASQPSPLLEVGFGTKKLKNMSKPLRSKLEKSGFSQGFTTVRGMKMAEGMEAPQAGTTITVAEVLTVGDVVKVQGQTKGKGFAGGMKRHGFHGSKRTHGQSDRERAPGSIGSGTTPGRVFKGKKMAGHMGVETQTVLGLVVLHIEPTTGEIWLNGPIPGANQSLITITKTGNQRQIELDMKASGIKAPAAEVTEVTVEATPTPEETTPQA